MDLECGHAGERPGGGPDLGREVRQGGQVVAHDRGGVGETAAGELHSVARVAREANHHAFAFFDRYAPFDASHFFVIIPDAIGHGKSSKPSDALKTSFPHYGYADMVDLQHKLLVETLGVTPLHAVVGMSMGCMNAWQWAEAYPGAVEGIMPVVSLPIPVSGRNLLWRRMVIDSIRSDPGLPRMPFQESSTALRPISTGHPG